MPGTALRHFKHAFKGADMVGSIDLTEIFPKDF